MLSNLTLIILGLGWIVYQSNSKSTFSFLQHNHSTADHELKQRRQHYLSHRQLALRHRLPHYLGGSSG